MFPIRTGSLLSREQRREALELLFDEACDRDLRVERVLDAFENAELDPAGFLTCRDGERALGVLIAEVLPGNSANVWPVRARSGPARTGVEDALYARAHRLLAERGAKFAQTFLPTDNVVASAALLRNAFQRVTRLWNMRCDLPVVVSRPADGIRIEPLPLHNPGVVEDVLSETFVESLDFPELDGLRGPDEVLAGHLGGAPDLTRWWLARVDGVPAGVLILADGQTPEVWELSYLGVVPRARRRGIGRALLAHALRQAFDAGTRMMTLLVDERNRAAIDLYKRFGFRLVDVRDVYLRIVESSDADTGERPSD